MKTSTPVTILICTLFFTGAGAQKVDRKKAILNSQEPKTLSEVKEYAIGQWKSIAVELISKYDKISTKHAFFRDHTDISYYYYY